MQIKHNIIDEKLLRKIERLAKKKGQTLEECWAEVATKAARIFFGMDTDLSPVEVAGRLGVHINTVMNYLKLGKFKKAYQTSGRRIRIPLSDVEALKARRVNTTTN